MITIQHSGLQTSDNSKARLSLFGLWVKKYQESEPKRLFASNFLGSGDEVSPAGQSWSLGQCPQCHQSRKELLLPRAGSLDAWGSS